MVHFVHEGITQTLLNRMLQGITIIHSQYVIDMRTKSKD